MRQYRKSWKGLGVFRMPSFLNACLLILKDAMLVMLISAASAETLNGGKTRWFQILFILLAILV